MATFYAKSAPTIAEKAPMVKTPATLETPPLVPRPLVGEDRGVLVDLVKLLRTEFAELMTPEIEDREEETPLGSETEDGVPDPDEVPDPDVIYEAGRVVAE